MTRRKLELMVTGFTGPPPGDPAKIEELAALSAAMPATYSQHEHCLADGSCLDFEQLNRILGAGRAE